jgi:acyl dehydratase
MKQDKKQDGHSGPRRCSTRRGRYFEEFTVGDVYEHWPGRTISEADNTWFTLLTMNQHPIHFDHEYAAKSEFGQPLVASPLTLAILVGQSVADVSLLAIANLGWTDVKMTGPVFIGDTLYAESEIISKRVSKSRPHQGIVTVKTTGHNQHREVICTFCRSMLIPFTGHGVED